MSPRREEPLEVYTVTFHPPDDSWLSSARHHDLRMELAAVAVDAVEAGRERPMIVFPAGFLRTPSADSRDGLASSMLELALRADVGLAFGIDIGSDEAWAPIAGTPQSFGYLCDGGKLRLWTVEQLRSPTSRRGIANRCVSWCGRRAALLLSGEVFNLPLRKTLAEQRPDVILHLTHVGPNERWLAAMEELNRIAPVVIAGETRATDAPLWAQRASGWVVEAIAETRSMSLHRHRHIETDPHFADDESDSPAAGP
ncbi:MAG TPA: hypothetical protein VFF06_30890 [Polyangia bacterium]|nr:hypothetical protein [Polyangia bacterium]